MAAHGYEVAGVDFGSQSVSAQVIALEPHKRTLWKLLDKARDQRREIDLLFNEVAYYNLTHPDREPIDADPDGELRRTAEMLDALLKANA